MDTIYSEPRTEPMPVTKTISFLGHEDREGMELLMSGKIGPNKLLYDNEVGGWNNPRPDELAQLGVGYLESARQNHEAVEDRDPSKHDPAFNKVFGTVENDVDDAERACEDLGLIPKEEKKPATCYQVRFGDDQ